MVQIFYVEGNNHDLENVVEILHTTWHRKPDEFVYSLSSELYGHLEMISYYKEIHDMEIINPIIVTNNVALLQEVVLDYHYDEPSDELFIVKYTNDGYKFYNIKKYYPNIRKENNIMKMYLANIFEDFLGE